MPRLSIGALQTRVIIETPSETPDGLGGVKRNWVSGEAVWCDISTLSTQQRLEAEQLGQTLTHRVTMRWRANLTTQMRLRRAGQVLAIRGVSDPDNARRELVCLCEELRP
jgi:SPP1 family predicted phage head-tail adaptor